MTDPLAFVDTCPRETGAHSLVFTQHLHDLSADPSWWYLAPQAGRHISFYAPARCVSSPSAWAWRTTRPARCIC
ncbi:hypothetical protein ACFV1W_39160 [Kitasatospora sp. NPDC059648]|uniref:hypothetical protein n=1 Tax=Kitasatospora sp. NPDC059648 TaxID=3346894 RepID=UPI0036A93E40